MAIVMIFLLVLGAVFETIGVAVVVPLIGVLTDENFQDKYPWISTSFQHIGIESKYWIVFFSLFAVVILYLIKNIYLSFLVYIKVRYTLNIRLKLSSLLFSSYLYKPYTFHMQRNTSQLIQAITRESENYSSNILFSLISLIGELFVVIGLVILLAVVVSVTTLFVIVVFAITAYFVYKSTRRKMKEWGATRQENEVKKLKEIQHGLNGIKYVKMTGSEHVTMSTFSNFDNKAATALKKGMFVQEMPRMIFEIVALLSLLIVVFITFIDSGGTDQALATMALFSVATFRLLPSSSKIVSALHSLRYYSSSVYMLENDLREAGESAQIHKESNGSTFNFSEVITVSGVDFTYPGSSTKSLDNVNLSIKFGTMIAITGSSGAGKSTLVDLIIGLLAPDNGNVYVDGNNINDNLTQWQKNIGYVPQEIYLIDDSLRKNIAFGVPDNEIDELALRDAISLAQLDSFIDSQPNKLETIVGEHGVRMSGGQRQRVGIARALYSKPTIVVFDEATSALDGKTEASVMRAISDLKGQITMIIIAHRLDSIVDCDVVFSIDSGKLVDKNKCKS